MKIIFNSSLPRSGSTLLQNLLAQNPSVYASPTSGLLELIYGARANYTECNEFKAQDAELMKKAFLSFCKAGVEGWCGAVTDKPICLDKSRGWLHYYEWLNQFLPNPKVIVCVRDITHILGSMEKLYRKNMDKADKADSPAQMSFVTVHQRIAHWLNSQPVGLALLRLHDAIQRGNLDKFCIVRYEDLMTEPEKVLKHIYNYIEEPYFEHDLKNIQQITKEDDGLYDIYGDHKIRPELKISTTDPISLFGKQACENIKDQCQWFYDMFYSSKYRFY